MRNYRPPLGAGRLVAGTLLVSLSVLAAIMYAGGSGPSAHQRRGASAAELGNTQGPGPRLGNDAELRPPGSLPDAVPPALPKVNRGLVTSLEGGLAISLDAVVSTTGTELVPSGGGPLVSQLEPAVAVSPALPPLPTAAELGGLTGSLGNAPSAVDPPQVDSITAGVASQAAVVDQGLGTATDVTAPDVLANPERLLKGIDSSADSLVRGVVAGVDDLENALRSGLDDVVAVSGGPADLVGSLIENVCSVVTAVDGVVQSISNLCGAMSLVVSAAEQGNPLIGPTDPVTDADALLPAFTGTSSLPPSDVPPLPSPLGSLPLPLPLPTDPGAASITAPGVGPPDGGAETQPIPTNTAQTGAPGAAPGSQAVSAEPSRITMAGGKCGPTRQTLLKE